MSDEDTNTKDTIYQRASKMQDSDIVDWKEMTEKSQVETKKIQMETKKIQMEIEKLEKETKKIKTENEKLILKKKNLEMEAEKFIMENKKMKMENEKLKKEKEESEASHDKLSYKKLITAPPQVVLKPAGACNSSNDDSNTYKNAEVMDVAFEFALKSKTNENGTKSFELDDHLSEKLKYMPSTLLLHFFKKNKVEQSLSYSYCSKADVSALIDAALEDATYLARCKTGRNFVTRHEYSIFSLKPDYFVVLEDNVPLLTVDDKKPLKRKESDLGPTYGQLYDNAMMMRAFRTCASFLIFTCFEETQMLWLDTDQSNAIACNKDGVRDNFFAMSLSTSKQGKVKTPSPLYLKPSDVQTGFQSLNSKRVLNSSGSFDSTHLVPLLYTAVLCAAMSIPQEQSKLKIPLLENEIVKDRETLKMESKQRQYDWGTLSATVGQPIDDKNCYYMMDIIGMGSTSKVFYALHSSGKPCVIKMFVNRMIEDEDGETLTKDDWMKVAEKKTRTEKENFDNLYPSLKDEVKLEMILGFYCVVMPFFTPLKTNAEQQESKNKIKQVLKRFHEKKLQYLDCDLRWCHIGRYNEEIILYDLADLTLLGDEESNWDVFVNKCLEGL